MAVTSRALHLKFDGADADEVRRFYHRMFGDVNGVWTQGDMPVSAGAGMNVVVGSGSAVVAGTENSEQGGYYVENVGDLTLSLAAADSTNDRHDLIVVRVRDEQYSGLVSEAQIVPVTGTPSATPVDPAVPVNSIVLARVLVESSTTVPGAITDLRGTGTQDTVVKAASTSEIVSSASGYAGSPFAANSAATLLTLPSFTPVDGFGYELHVSSGYWWGSGGTPELQINGLEGEPIMRLTNMGTSSSEGKTTHAAAFYDSLDSFTTSLVGTRISGTAMTNSTIAPMRAWVRRTPLGY